MKPCVFPFHVAIGLVLLLVASCAMAGHVTLVTHGYNSDGDGWVKGLGEAISQYPRRLRQYPGEATMYRVSFDSKGVPRGVRIAGPAPDQNPSGDIILLLDWNPYSGIVLGSEEQSTTVIGPVIANNFMLDGFIPEVGKALARFPLHFIGHSRGGSLVCEIAKRLGERSVVVDHLTLLDPHPVKNDGFENDVADQFVNVVDGTARKGVYENVLFADSVYQTSGSLFTPNGTFVEGAFVRYLHHELSGNVGYGSTHSDVHLWYHGIAQFLAPLTPDGDGGSLSLSARGRWYSVAEEQGRLAGYFYSMHGGGSRRSAPAAANEHSGVPAHGLNSRWAAALGVTGGGIRTSVVRTAERRANLLEVSLSGQRLADDNTAALGGPIKTVQLGFGASDLKLEIVYTSDIAGTVQLRVLLDKDENTLNGWERSLDLDLHETKGLAVRTNVLIGTLAAGAAPWLYHLGVLIGPPTAEREMYTPERLLLVPDLRLEWVQDARAPQGQTLRVVGPLNLKVNLEASVDLETWAELEPLSLSTTTDNPITGMAKVSGIDFAAGPYQYLRARAQ